MDRNKKPSSLMANHNSRIYMDLKDIIRDNALRFLPAKSLRRCTSVCREWKLQISTPFFAHNQSNSFSEISGFFYQSPSGTITFVSLDPLAFGIPDPLLKFLPESVDIRCSSNGLLCCQGRTGYRAYYICNPVTQKWKEVPKPTADHGPDPALVLVFQPSLLNFVAEYKLVCAFPSDLGGYEFEIYSSAAESWRISGEICFGNWQILPSTGIYVGGNVYWQTNSHRVVAFDLTIERLTFISHSYEYGGLTHRGEAAPLGEVNGKLCSVALRLMNLTVSELSNPFTNTMQMHSRAQAWGVKRHINLNNYVRNSEHLGQGSVEFVGDVTVIRLGGKLYSYNMKTKVMTQLASEVDFGLRMLPYVNSLVEI